MTERQRQIDRDRKTDIYTERLTVRQTDRQTYRNKNHRHRETERLRG